MGNCFLHGNGGGTSLNFKVVGNPKPSSSKENTIWIDTDEEITSWVFSPTEPAVETGMVWIHFGISGEVSFNALKKNGIALYPTEAYQYINGSWVKKTAQIYQDGEWVDFILYLFNNGDVAKVSGGWTTISGKSGAYSGGTPSCTVYDDRIVASTNDSIGFLRHNNLVDLTPYTKVHFSGSAIDNSGYTGTGNCCPVIMPDGATDIGSALVKQALTAFGSFTDLTIDVTNINQKAWIGWWFYDWNQMSANGTVTLRKVWLT